MDQLQVERCLRQGETCNIAASGYDTTVCRYATSGRIAQYSVKASITRQNFSVLNQSSHHQTEVLSTQSSVASLPRQKYSWRRLLALDKDGEQYVDSFR